MIGSPQNTFNPNYQTQSQPRNVMLGNALRNQGPMLSQNQYGEPTTLVPSWVQPQSNMSGKLQPSLNNFNAGLNRPTGM